jgi:cytoskeletal protein RodZ
MRRTPALALSAVALTLALGLAGCATEPANSDSTSSESSAPSSSDSSSAPSQPADTGVAPATGSVVSGDGYSYTIPVGWAQQDAALAPGTDTVAADSAPTGPFANNVNVVLSPAGAFTPDNVEAAAGNELETAGATEVQVLDRVTVAGEETAHVTAVMTVSDLTYRIHQYYVTSDDQTYVVTFSAAVDVPNEEMISTAESVLATWTWA